MRVLVQVCGLVSFCCLSLAQQTALTGPTEGFTFDVPTRSLRAVIGAVGSASLGPVLFPSVDYGSIAPQKDYGIVARGRGYILVSGLSSGKPSSRVLAPETPSGEGIVWSRDGSTAVLYSRAGNWIQLFSDLPNSPEVGSVIDLSVLGGSLTAIALDTQGNEVAVAISGNAAGVYSMKKTSGFVLLLSLANPIALAFSSDGANLFALDQASNSISAIGVGSSALFSWTLGGLQDPFAIAAGSDSSNAPAVYVASRSDRMLRAYNPATGQPTASLALGFRPAGIESLGPASFLLANRINQGDPLWTLSTVSTPAVVFIPATPLPAVDPHQTHLGGRNQ